jgi:hypothetical protein
VGVVCIACGIVSRIVFEVYAPPFGRADMVEQACIQFLWYGVGLFLLLIELRRWQAKQRGGFGVAVVWLLWALGGIAAWAAVMISMPP